MKKHIVTIAGRLGSGKSSTAKTVAGMLNYEHFSSGDLFREIAAEQSQSVLDANVAAEKDSSIDHLVDQKLRDIGEQEDFKVVDSRTAWHWMPESFKVYLKLPTEIAAKRIIDKAEERKTANEDIPSSVGEYAKLLDVRYHSENKRYKNLYDIDPSDMSNYDLVLDTSKQNLSEVAESIVVAYKEWLDS
jgi:cytidylate kinase